jgi:hypothetical protein
MGKEKCIGDCKVSTDMWRLAHGEWVGGLVGVENEVSRDSR